MEVMRQSILLLEYRSRSAPLLRREPPVPRSLGRLLARGQFLRHPPRTSISDYRWHQLPLEREGRVKQCGGRKVQGNVAFGPS